MLAWLSSWIWSTDSLVDKVEDAHDDSLILETWSGEITKSKVFVIGPEGCGKSTLIQRLAPNATQIPDDIASNTWALNSWLDFTLRRHKDNLKNQKATIEAISLKWPVPKNHRVMNLWINSRSFRLTVLAELTDPTVIPPQIRSDNLIYCFPSPSQDFRSSVYKYFTPPLEESQFDKVLASLKPYECLVWRTSLPHEDGDKNVYRLSCPNHE